jgi:hypothetical protein
LIDAEKKSKLYPYVVSIVDSLCYITHAIGGIIEDYSAGLTVPQTPHQLKTLNQFILAKAFCGKLVAKDFNNEPAAVLLERIRQEKAKQEKHKQQKSMPSGNASINTTEASNYTPKQLDLGL